MKTKKQILHKLETLMKECDIFEEKLKSSSAHPLQHQQYQEAVRVYNARISELNWVYYGDGSITCPKCGMESHNQNDVANKYCGYCNIFHDEGL